MIAPAWEPIATAPDFDRIWVCGWQEQNGTTRGYWWWHEDMTQNGVALEHPEATHWCEIQLPEFPEPHQRISAILRDNPGVSQKCRA